MSRHQSSAPAKDVGTGLTPSASPSTVRSSVRSIARWLTAYRVSRGGREERSARAEIGGLLRTLWDDGVPLRIVRRRAKRRVLIPGYETLVVARVR